MSGHVGARRAGEKKGRPHGGLQPGNTDRPYDGLLQFLLGSLLVLAPLFRSGKTPLALAGIGLIAVLALALILARGGLPKMAASGKVLLACVLLFPILQWMPIPGLSRDLLPGQDDYQLAISLATKGAELGATSLSPIFRETLLGWMILLIPFAVYLVTRSLNTHRLRVLIRIMVGVAVFEAVLGLVQFGGGPDSPWYLGLEHTHFGSAVGTYTSRNNYVGMMYLTLMVCLSMFLATLGRRQQRMKMLKAMRRQQSKRQRIAYWASGQGHRAFLYGAICVLLLLAIIFSRSRGGISVTMLGVVLVTMALSARIGGDTVRSLSRRLMVIGGGLAVAVGLGPVLERFTQTDPLTDGRWIIFDGVFTGIGQFFPLGVGTGTFRQTFPAFQDLEYATATINRAHNSYLEWIYNGGVPAAVLIAVLLAFFAARWFSIWRREQWGEFRYVQVGAGIGMLLMLLHDLVDYNFFVPANMVYFAFFAGLFFYPYQEPLRVKVERAGDPFAAPPPQPSRATTPMDWGDEEETASGQETNPFSEDDDDVKEPFVGDLFNEPGTDERSVPPSAADDEEKDQKKPGWNPFMDE